MRTPLALLVTAVLLSGCATTGGAAATAKPSAESCLSRGAADGEALRRFPGAERTRPADCGVVGYWLGRWWGGGDPDATYMPVLLPDKHGRWR